MLSPQSPHTYSVPVSPHSVPVPSPVPSVPRPRIPPSPFHFPSPCQRPMSPRVPRPLPHPPRSIPSHSPRSPRPPAHPRVSGTRVSRSPPPARPVPAPPPRWGPPPRRGGGGWGGGRGGAPAAEPLLWIRGAGPRGWAGAACEGIGTGSSGAGCPPPAPRRHFWGLSGCLGYFFFGFVGFFCPTTLGFPRAARARPPPSPSPPPPGLPGMEGAVGTRRGGHR